MKRFISLSVVIALLCAGLSYAALEDLTGGSKYISDLINTNPVGATDPKSEGDDHIRGIKNTLLNTFPSITGAVTSTHTELNILDGVTSTAAELNILDGVTSTAAELNILDGVTSTAAELNILDGVTSDATEINLLDGETAFGTAANADTGVSTGNVQLVNQAVTTTASATSVALGTTLYHTITGTTQIDEFTGVDGVTYHCGAAGDLPISQTYTAGPPVSGINIRQGRDDITLEAGSTFDVYINALGFAQVENIQGPVVPPSNGSKSADGNFTSGTIRYSRSGSNVCVSFTDLAHLGSSGPSTNASFLPAAYRPTVEVRNLYRGQTDIREVRIDTGGEIYFSYHDMAGAPTALTGTGTGSICYAL